MKKLLFIVVLILGLQLLHAEDTRYALYKLPEGTYREFHDGMAIFKDPNTFLYGAINTNGEIVIPATYKEMSDFVGGASYVVTSNGYGFISKTGHFLLQPDNNILINKVFHKNQYGDNVPIEGLYEITDKGKTKKGFWYNNKMLIPLTENKTYTINFPYITWTDSASNTQILFLTTGIIHSGTIRKYGHLHAIEINTSHGVVKRFYDLEGEEITIREASSKEVRFSTLDGLYFNLINQQGDTILSAKEGWRISVPTWQQDMICAYKMVVDSINWRYTYTIRLYDAQGKTCLERISSETLFSGWIEGNGFIVMTADSNLNVEYELYSFQGKKHKSVKGRIENISGDWYMIGGGDNHIYNISTKNVYPCSGIHEFSENMIIGYDKNKTCHFIINMQTGKYTTIKNASYINAYSEGLAIVHGKDNKAYAIDKNGKVILQDCNEYKFTTFSSSEGVIPVRHNHSYAYIYNPLIEGTPIYGQEEYNEWLYKKAEKLYEQKKYTQAKEMFYDIMLNDPTNVAAINYYGCCLERLGYYDSAIDAFLTILRIDPNNKLAIDNIEVCRSNKQIAEQNQAYSANQTMTWVDGLTQFFSALGNAFAQYADFTTDMNTARNFGYSGNNGSSASSHHQSGNDNVIKSRDARTYSDLESQLIKMHTYPSTYNDNQRKSIQSQMRHIRTKWESKGFRMFHSPWEDWNGQKQ